MHGSARFVCARVLSVLRACLHARSCLLARHLRASPLHAVPSVPRGSGPLSPPLPLPHASSVSLTSCRCARSLAPHPPPARAVSLKSKAGPKLKDFRDYLNTNSVPEIEALREDVEAFAKRFPTVGFEKASMRYQD